MLVLLQIYYALLINIALERSSVKNQLAALHSVRWCEIIISMYAMKAAQKNAKYFEKKFNQIIFLSLLRQKLLKTNMEVSRWTKTGFTKR